MLCLRGTTVAIFDYAFFCKKMFNIDCSVIYNETLKQNSEDVISKFKKEFEIVKSYRDERERLQILEEIRPDKYFVIKSGKWDNNFSPFSENLVMAVAANISVLDRHGDKYYVCSKWLNRITNIDYVPHMINLPDTQENFRKELNIPEEALVFGRNGGNDTFDLVFVKEAIKQALNLREDIYFLFQNTDKFINHERVIYLEPSANMIEKVKFINTSDVHLHARHIGESFGLTCGEFSSKNKPVLTWYGSPERNHIEVLGNRGLYYNNSQDILEIFLKLRKENLNGYWDCYEDYLPEKVMEIFKKKYLE